MRTPPRPSLFMVAAKTGAPSWVSSADSATTLLPYMEGLPPLLTRCTSAPLPARMSTVTDASITCGRDSAISSGVTGLGLPAGRRGRRSRHGCPRHPGSAASVLLLRRAGLSGEVGAPGDHVRCRHGGRAGGGGGRRAREDGRVRCGHADLGGGRGGGGDGAARG